jgi:hypothetical protein
MSIAMSLTALRAAADDELIKQHDKLAATTQAGVDYYLNELRRRDEQRAIAASENLARAAFWVSVTNTVLVFVTAVVAVLAISS